LTERLDLDEKAAQHTWAAFLLPPDVTLTSLAIKGADSRYKTT